MKLGGIIAYYILDAFSDELIPWLYDKYFGFLGYTGPEKFEIWRPKITQINPLGYFPWLIIVLPLDPPTSTIELKNDDGNADGNTSWGGACPLSGNLDDGSIGFIKYLDLPIFTFEVLNVKVDFAKRNKYDAGFYLRIKDEKGVDLLPTPYIISSEEVNVDGWWEYDVSSHDIKIRGSRIEVSIFERYLPANCPPDPDWSIHGWTIRYDKNSYGNSIMKGPTRSFTPEHEFMIRLEGRLQFSIF